MLISPADVRRLMESDDPGSTLVIYESRAAVISAGDLTADRYPGGSSSHHSMKCWTSSDGPWLLSRTPGSSPPTWTWPHPSWAADRPRRMRVRQVLGGCGASPLVGPRALPGRAMSRLGSAPQMPVRRLNVGLCLSVADLAVVVEDAIGFPVALAGRAGQDVTVRQAYDRHLDQSGVRCRDDRAIPGPADEDCV